MRNVEKFVNVGRMCQEVVVASFKGLCQRWCVVLKGPAKDLRTDRQTNRQTDRQTDGQTDRQTYPVLSAVGSCV